MKLKDSIKDQQWRRVKELVCTKRPVELQGCIGKIARLNDGSYKWGKSNIQ